MCPKESSDIPLASYNATTLCLSRVSVSGPEPLLDTKSPTKSEKLASGTRLCLSRVSAIVQTRALLETKSHTQSRISFCRCTALSFQSVKDPHVLFADFGPAIFPTRRCRPHPCSGLPSFVHVVGIVIRVRAGHCLTAG